MPPLYTGICRHSESKVNGRLHAGYVIVVLNGSDYYEVYLVKGMDVECVNNEVCFDELGGVIDRAIESRYGQSQGMINSVNRSDRIYM